MAGRSKKASRTKGRPRRLGPTNYYSAARVRHLKESALPRDRPLPLGEGWFGTSSKRWIKFIHPDGTREISLLIPENGKPLEAMREWFFRCKAVQDPPAAFDVHAVLPAWNYGDGPRLETRECGWLHTGVGRSVEWGPYINHAIKVWSQRKNPAPYPPDLLAILEPSASVPPISLPPDVAPEDRSICLAIDLSRPLEAQFAESLKLCERLRGALLFLLDEPLRRPGRREVRRDVLMFTLRQAAGMTIPAIAREIFPKERQATAQEKVKKILRRVREALAEGST